MPVFASYDGTELYYECSGDGAPLVCLAGGPGADVRSLGELGGIGARRTVVLLDARAAGRSAVPADRESCAFTEQARDVDELRRVLGADRIDVLAHSAGALTAQEYAARFPGRLGKLVLVTPAGRVAREVDDTELAMIRAAQAGAPWYPAAMAALREPSADARLVAPFWYGGWSDAVAQHFDLEERLPEPPPWLRKAFYRGQPAATFAGLARLRRVPNSVLVLAGAADGVAGVGPAERVAAAYPAGRLVVLAECGHWPWLNRPAHFRTTVDGFLGDR